MYFINAFLLKEWQQVAHIGKFVFRFDVGYLIAFALQKLLVGLHAGAMKDQFLFVKIVLAEEKILLHQIDQSAFYYSRWPFKKLMGKDEDSGLFQNEINLS